MSTHIRRLRQREAIADALMNFRRAPIFLPPLRLNLPEAHHKQGRQKNR
jgi:hypothetical protein